MLAAQLYPTLCDLMGYVAHQAPLSLEFSRQEYWSGLPFSSSGDLPDLGIEPGSPVLLADSLPSEPPGKPGEIASYNKSIWDVSTSLLSIFFVAEWSF